MGAESRTAVSLLNSFYKFSPNQDTDSGSWGGKVRSWFILHRRTDAHTFLPSKPSEKSVHHPHGHPARGRKEDSNSVNSQWHRHAATSAYTHVRACAREWKQIAGKRGPFSGLGVFSPFRDARSSSKPTVAPEADALRRGWAVGARLRPGELRRASGGQSRVVPVSLGWTWHHDGHLQTGAGEGDRP